MRRLLSLIVLTMLLLSVSGRSAATQLQYDTCVPGTHPVGSELVSFDVTGGELKGKIFTPIAPTDPGFEPGSMTGVVMTHGYGPTAGYPNLESQAASLAAGCRAVLIHSYRGQGAYHTEMTAFDWYLNATAADDVLEATDRLKEHELVHDTDPVLVIRGFSQGAIHVYHAMHSLATRSQYDAAIPYDGFPLSVERLAPQRCIATSLARFADSRLVRQGMDNVGITWNPIVLGDLQTYYVASPPNVSQLVALIGARQLDFEEDLENPYPNLFGIIGEYDAQQFTDEVMDEFTDINPAFVPSDGWPAKRALITTGGHVDPEGPWFVPEHEEYRRLQMLAWMDKFAPSGTPPPAWDREPVEYIVDSYHSTGAPSFGLQGADSWPIASDQTIRLYLHANGLALEEIPGSGGGFDTIEQRFDESGGYTMSTAVNVDDPYFESFYEQLDLPLLAEEIYTSPVLAQDVVLVAPPTATLFGDSNETNYQVHIRVLEKFDSALGGYFVARANACTWGGQPPSPNVFEGQPFTLGDTRFHRFKAGNRIQLQFITYDVETYWPDRAALYMTPVLADFELDIDHDALRPTNVQLPLVLSSPGNPVFISPTGGGMPQGGPSSSSQPESLWSSLLNGLPQRPLTEATPTPEPLAITASLYDDLTNPGGWRSWAPEVHLACSGGEGQVTCPETQFVFTDGISQTVSYTATDEIGTVVTATLTGISVDRTPPVVAVAAPELPAACAGMLLEIDYTVSDALSGVSRSTVTFNGQAVNLGDTVLLVAGVNTLNVETRDVAGNLVTEEVALQCDA